MQQTKDTLKAKGEPQGKSITINAEICSSWGFLGNKRAVIEVAQILSEAGYGVDYTINPVPGGSGIFTISIISKDGTKKIVFSNDSSHKDAIINYTASTKKKEIIDKIVANI